MAKDLDTPVDEQVLEQDEQDVEVESQEEGDGDSGASSEDDQPRTRKPFLEVDDRTKYMTAEDAKKGFSEAGKRIAQLSAWEKELSEYGELTPAEVRAYLDELIESRQTAAQMRAELEKYKQERERADKDAKETSTRVQGESKMTKEEKEAVEWLKEKLPSLGYISQADAMKLISELQGKTAEIDKITGWISQQEQTQRTALIEDSRTKLGGWMKDDGYSDDEDHSLQMMIEDSIRNWIDGDATGKRSNRFYAGGASKDAVVKEGYERAKKALGMLKTSSTSTYVRNKAEQLRSGKKLPQQGITEKGRNSDANVRPRKKIDASGKRDFIGEKHNQAWEVASKYFRNNEEQ